MNGRRTLRLGFAGQFLAFGFIVLVGGMLTIGFWIQREITDAVINRTAGVTSLYVNAMLSPHIESLRDGRTLDASAVESLDRMLEGPGLARDIVAFKIWAADGTVLYSPNKALIGQSFAVEGHLSEAFSGGVVSRISDLSDAENMYESQVWDTLIETYAPIRLEGSTRPVTVAEFYQTPAALQDEIRSAQIRSWLIVVLATVVMYALLAGIVGRASGVMKSQRRELEENVTHLGGLLEQNRKLQDRMRQAAGRTTALNEEYLRRISADLHDGPAQDVSFALLRLDDIAGPAASSPHGQSKQPEDMQTIRYALDSAMTDIRSIASGLRLPELEDLNPTDTAQRVVRDFERATGTEVEFHADGVPAASSLPAKITIYRVLQEALANSYKHAPGATQTVRMSSDGAEVRLTIADNGPGFDPATVTDNGAQGLVGMRERVEMLGGWVEIDTKMDRGTTVTASVPLHDE